MITVPCQCGRQALLYEGRYDGGWLFTVKCACGIEGASVTCKKPEDRELTAWAAVDGWRISNGNGMPQ